MPLCNAYMDSSGELMREGTADFQCFHYSSILLAMNMLLEETSGDAEVSGMVMKLMV